MENDVLICFGGEVKALEDGRIEGYLVRFSSAQDPDISKARDFFTPRTDFDLERSTKATIYFDHGLDDTLEKRKLGIGEMKVDDVGVWISGILNRRDKYEEAIYQMGRAGKLGWSSGTAIHLCDRKKVGDAHEVLSWPLGLDASLTPTPAEPRNDAITTLKSYDASRLYIKFIDDVAEIAPRPQPTAEVKAEDAATSEPAAQEIKQVSTDPAPAAKQTEEAKAAGIAEEKAQGAAIRTEDAKAKHREWIKGIFETTLEEYLEEQQTPWMLIGAFERAFYKICEAAEAADLLASTIDFNGLIQEAVNEFAARLQTWARNEFAKRQESEAVMSPSYLSMRSPLKFLVERNGQPQAGFSSEFHSEMALAAAQEFVDEALTLTPALKSWVERRKSIAELRATKAGRVISAATADRMGRLKKKIATARTEMNAMESELDDLMNLSKPKEVKLEDGQEAKCHETAAAEPAKADVIQTEAVKSLSDSTSDDAARLEAEFEHLRFLSTTAGYSAVGVS